MHRYANNLSDKPLRNRAIFRPEVLASSSITHRMNASVIGQTEHNRIRLILVDHHVLFRSSLARFLCLEPDFDDTWECGTFAEALELVQHQKVDVILFDSALSHANEGNAFVNAARDAGYQGRFLVLADAPDALNSALALNVGVSGIFLKSEAPDRLVQAIKLVCKGDMWVASKVIQLLAHDLVESYPKDPGAPAVLSEREKSVLSGIVGGLSNRMIGLEIGLSESSVKAVVQGLFAKASVRTRSQLVRVALEGSLGRMQPLMVGNQTDNLLIRDRKRVYSRFRCCSRATRTSWLRVRTPLFVKSCWSVFLTALSEISNLAAICLFGKP